MGLVPGLRAGSPASGWRCILRPALVPGAVPPSTRLGPAPSRWVPLLWAWCVWGASNVGFSCVFLRDVVTLWVNSVSLSLLIANEGLHGWLFLSNVANPFWGRGVVFISTLSASRNFLWLVAALLPGWSLIFDSGLSSPGLICCLAMSLRYVDLLSCGGAPTVCLATGFVAFLPVLHSPAGSG